MKLKWYGHSCFAMTLNDGTVIVTDPFDETVGYPVCTAKADIALTSHGHFDHNYVQSLQGEPVVLATPGKHEVCGVSVTGVHSFHDDAEGSKRGENVIFIVEADGMRIAHLGDLGHMPNEEQLEALKNVDVMLLPVGGFFTITGTQAYEIVKAAKPRCAVAMHFSNDYCHFPVSDWHEFGDPAGAVEMPNEIEFASADELPAAMVMKY